MNILGPAIGLLLVTVGSLWLVRLVRRDPPPSQSEAVSELFRGPPISVNLAVLVIATGVLFIVIPPFVATP